MIQPAPISPRPARATSQIGRPVNGSVPPGGKVEFDLVGAAVVDVVGVGFPWATSVMLNAARKVGAVVGGEVNGGSVLLADTAGSAGAAVVEDGAVAGVMDAACPPVVVSVGVDAAVEVMTVPDGAVVVDADVVVPVDLEVDVDVVVTTSACV
jgi:hypothetical protein